MDKCLGVDQACFNVILRHISVPPVLSFTCFPTMILNLEQCISGVKSGRYHMEPHKIQGDF